MKNKISNGVLWQGFNYQWKSMPHRLSILGSQFNNLVVHNQMLSVYHDKLLKIGNFPKGVADYKIGYNALQLQGVFWGNGRTQILEIETPYQIAFEHVYEVRVCVDDLIASFQHNPGTNQKLHSSIKVVLNGFVIKAKGNDSGWHFGGLGIELNNARWIGHDTIGFEVQTFCRPANSPEPLHHGNVERRTSRRWKNHHPCRYELIVDYAVFIGSSNQLYIEDRTIEQEVVNRRRMDHSEEVCFSFDPDRFQTAFPAITGFCFKLSAHRKRAKKTGRYIRNLGINVEDVDLDNQNGQLKCRGGFHFSNTIFDRRVFTAYPWNLQAKLCLSQIASSGIAISNYNSLTGKTNNSEDHIYPKRITCPLQNFPL